MNSITAMNEITIARLPLAIVACGGYLVYKAIQEKSEGA